jgi:glucose/mannose-6-phosphate isomerase
MRDLDQHESFATLDPQNMLGHIDGLPGQLQKAWGAGQRQPLPKWHGVERILIAGMGGSAIGADLLAAYVENNCSVPVVVHRDYNVPAWATGPQTLVITSSHSGNTEETLSSFQMAVENGCRCLSITTGGQLAEAARQAQMAVWLFEHHGQPRAAVGFSFGLLLALFARMGLIPDPAGELEEAVSAMKKQQQTIQAHIPATHNPAKRMAGQLIGRWVSVFGAGILNPVARRWKGQISEIAKAWAQFEFLPEADHNSLAGTVNPEELLGRTTALFLRCPADHPRNRLRLDVTRRTFMLEGISTDFVDGKGETPLGNQWTALHFGDYTAYYLAMAYGVDPTPVAALEDLKEELQSNH